MLMDLADPLDVVIYLGPGVEDREYLQIQCQHKLSVIQQNSRLTPVRAFSP